MNSFAVHLGGCGTLHANRPQDIPARIEALALLAGVSREAVHSQASAALRLALHLDRDQFGRRYLQSVAVVRRRGAVGPIQASVALTFDRTGQTREWTGYPLLLEELERTDHVEAGTTNPPCDREAVAAIPSPRSAEQSGESL